MQIDDFKRITKTFADPGTDLLFEKSRVVLSVNGDLIDAELSTKSGDVYVDEGSGPQPASVWILTRLAKLQLLANRLRESVAPTDFFVRPSGTYLPTLTSGPQDTAIETDDALGSVLQAITNRSPLESTVLYLTSDAGEGKTVLINELARKHAEDFVNNRSDWLLVPIPLGGRNFLRFDDLTVGVLQNRYRFPFLYYDSFLALVKMGVIVPAFDGFEEMMIESSSGEALSAMGILLGSLESKGAIIVAARKAYFEFENRKTQEQLFDTIRTLSVGFAKLELRRWDRRQFVAYGMKRGLTDTENIYRLVTDRLGANHPLLTRAVLVRRLVDVAKQSTSLTAFVAEIHQAGTDYFSVFVRTIIQREAHEKWIDRSGEKEIGTPLLSVDEHCDLLAQIAVSMWEARLDYLKRDILEFVADYFSETNRKNAFQAQQVKERIRGHALLVPSTNAPQAVEFDHDEFRLFFLGEGIAKQIRPLNDRAKADVQGLFRRGVLPRQAQHALIHAVQRDPSSKCMNVVKFLVGVASMDAQASYTQENCSDLIIRLLSGLPPDGLQITGLAFGPDALRSRKLSKVTFTDCYFSPSSLENSKLESCTFVRCKFAQLRIFSSTTFVNVALESCVVDAILNAELTQEVWDPVEIRRRLGDLGVIFPESVLSTGSDVTDGENVDDEIRDIQKIIRYFMRSTHISESVMLIKLGSRGHGFISSILPELLKGSVLLEIENRGGGDQRRFRLGIPVQQLTSIIASVHGSYKKLLEQIATTN